MARHALTISALLGTVHGLTTQTASPVKFNIQLSDLPQPFATKSASNSARQIPVPSNAVLRAPPGFEVSLIAEGFRGRPSFGNPRSLALHPSGDVLITESDEHIIYRCIDICIGICIDMCIDTCIDTCIDMRIDTRVGLSANRHVQRHECASACAWTHGLT